MDIPKFEWTDVAKVVAPFAPTLGGLIGGFIPFPGAALAGQALGGIIAKQFGVDPTPDAIHAAITSSPNEVVLAKLTAATEEAKAQWPAIAAIEKAMYAAQASVAESVNTTMRAEIGHEHWFYSGWRPFAGWLFDYFALVFGNMLAYAAYLSAYAGNDKPLTALTAAWPLFAIFLGALAAMVGVYIVGRSKERTADPTTIVAAPVVPAPVKKK